MQAVMRRRLNRDPEEAAIVIQSTWRMKQAQAEVSRLKQQQEAQLQAAAEQQVSLPTPIMHAGLCPLQSTVNRKSTAQSHQAAHTHHACWALSSDPCNQQSTASQQLSRASPEQRTL